MAFVALGVSLVNIGSQQSGECTAQLLHSRSLCRVFTDENGLYFQLWSPDQTTIVSYRFEGTSARNHGAAMRGLASREALLDQEAVS
jgi:hypothetical protein